MRILDLAQIKQALEGADLLAAMEQGFRDYSQGLCSVPPVGELLMDRGEVHIKYGCVHGDPEYLIKIASGFAGNSQLGLPTSNGLLLVFSQQTGALQCILLDEGYLTARRTAAAGALAARYLAPAPVEKIGILGTGVQARMQLRELRAVTDCREVLVWGRNPDHAAEYCKEFQNDAYRITRVADPEEIPATCNLIVTTTAASEPLFSARHLRPGTHITAIGSDTPHKQELDCAVLARADRVVADSIEQCLLRGEIYRALEAGAIQRQDITEIGHIISGETSGRTSDDQITVFDSTGVAVQDIRIAALVLEGSAHTGSCASVLEG